jgi:hypothetical protein
MEIFLVDVDGDGKAIDLHSTITAMFSTHIHKETRIELFRYASEQAVNVKPGEPIPLSSSALALSMGETLTFIAHLNPHGNIGPTVCGLPRYDFAAGPI